MSPNPNGSLDLNALRTALPAAVERLEGRFSYAHALFESRRGLRIQVASRERFASPSPPVRGVVLTVWDGRRFLEAAIDRVTGADLEWAISRLLEAPLAGGGACGFDPGPPLRADYFQRPLVDPADVPLARKIELAADLERRLRAAGPEVVSAAANYAEEHIEKLFAGRGRLLFQSLHRLSFSGQAYLSRNGTSRTARVGNSWSAGLERAAVSDEEIAAAVAAARAALSADRLEPGVYTVVGGPNVAGVIAHEAFGHGVEADLFLKRRAEAARYLGQPVASEIVDMYDSPAYPGLPASYFFDDEGALAAPTKIIDRGVLRNVLTDLHAAACVPAPRTANGRRESWQRKAYARMSNTYFGPGRGSREELVAQVERGLYIPESLDGMEDPKGWGIQVEGTGVQEIREGRLTGRHFQPVVITGYVPDLLHSIRAVAGDLRFEGLGMCQKGHKERVVVSIGGPHILFQARVG